MAKPVPNTIYSEDGEYLTLHSQGPEFSVYEDLDGIPVCIYNEYAWSQTDEEYDFINLKDYDTNDARSKI